MTTNNQIDFAESQQGDRFIIIDGLAGGTTLITAEYIHHEEEVICYVDKTGSDSFRIV